MELVILVTVIVALVFFALDTFTVPTRWSLTPAGLFLVTLALLLSQTVFKTAL